MRRAYDVSLEPPQQRQRNNSRSSATMPAESEQHGDKREAPRGLNGRKGSWMVHANAKLLSKSQKSADPQWREGWRKDAQHATLTHHKTGRRLPPPPWRSPRSAAFHNTLAGTANMLSIRICIVVTAVASATAFAPSRWGAAPPRCRSVDAPSSSSRLHSEATSGGGGNEFDDFAEFSLTQLTSSSDNSAGDGGDTFLSSLQSRVQQVQDQSNRLVRDLIDCMYLHTDMLCNTHIHFLYPFALQYSHSSPS